MTTTASAATTGAGAEPSSRRAAKNSRIRGGTVRHSTTATEHSRVTVAEMPSRTSPTSRPKARLPPTTTVITRATGSPWLSSQASTKQAAATSPELHQEDEHEHPERLPDADRRDQVDRVGERPEDGDAGEEAGDAQQPDDGPQLGRQPRRQRRAGPVHLHRPPRHGATVRPPAATDGSRRSAAGRRHAAPVRPPAPVPRLPGAAGRRRVAVLMVAASSSGSTGRVGRRPPGGRRPA